MRSRGLHLTIFTILDEMSNDGFVWKGPAVIRATDDRSADWMRSRSSGIQAISLGSAPSENSADHAAHDTADHANRTATPAATTGPTSSGFFMAADAGVRR